MIIIRGYGQYASMLTRGYGLIIRTTYREFRELVSLIGKRMRLIGDKKINLLS